MKRLIRFTSLNHWLTGKRGGGVGGDEGWKDGEEGEMGWSIEKNGKKGEGRRRSGKGIEIERRKLNENELVTLDV